MGFKGTYTKAVYDLAGDLTSYSVKIDEHNMFCLYFLRVRTFEEKNTFCL